MAQGLTVAPLSLEHCWTKAEASAAAILGEHLVGSNPIRQTILTYTHFAGVGAGYGYFAPNVPDTYMVAFELHYPNGQVKYELPTVGGSAVGLRLAGLLDEIGREGDEELRVAMMKVLAYSVWREHRDATMIHTLLGIVKRPTVAEYERGKRESYEFFYARDFRFHSVLPQSKNR